MPDPQAKDVCMAVGQASSLTVRAASLPPVYLWSVSTAEPEHGAGKPREPSGWKPDPVRLRRREDGAVEVRFHAVKNRAVSNRNCVAARRGGEHRNENDQSVTQTVRRTVAVNSIRSAWMGESAGKRRSL